MIEELKKDQARAINIHSSPIISGAGLLTCQCNKHSTGMLYQHHLQKNCTVLITTNTKNRIPIFLEAAYAFEAIETLYRTQTLYPFFLYGFVVMPDHCHLLMKAPDQDLSKIIGSFKKATASSIGIGPIWQSRFDAKQMPRPLRALGYIHQNPVKAGLVEQAENYPWSSASGKWDVSDLEI